MSENTAKHPGVRLAVDVGLARIGVAISDPHAILATPLETVPGPAKTAQTATITTHCNRHAQTKQAGVQPEWHAQAAKIADIAHQKNVKAIYVGLPLTLAGKETVSATHARSFTNELLKTLDATAVEDTKNVAQTGKNECSPPPGTYTPPVVHLVDERLTTVTAQGQLHATGRNIRTSRAVIDQQAAVVMLQNALEFERINGKLAGNSASTKREEAGI